jgi:hypothetical protein
VTNYEKRRISISDSVWTPITSPILAHRLCVRNIGPVGVSTRSNPSDPNTEDFLAAGDSEFMEFVLYCAAERPVFYAKVAAGSAATLIITAVN